MPNYGNAKFLYYQMCALKERGCLASVFLAADAPDVFAAGYLDCVTRQHFAMRAITPFGEADGYLARRMQDVFQVLSDEEYEERLDALITLNHARIAPLVLHEEISLFFVLLNIARERVLPVSIWTEESTYCGMVISVDELRVSFQSWDYFGHDEGEIALNLRDIQLVSVGSQEERMYQRLNTHQKEMDGIEF